MPRTPSSRFVALLRAINVGGHVVKMEALRKHFTRLGLANVEPFTSAAFDFTKHSLYIGFLGAKPKPETVRSVVALKTPVDEFHIHGKELYWGCRAARWTDSAVSGGALERAVGTPMTMRNVTT